MAMNLNSRSPGFVKEDCMLVLTVCIHFQGGEWSRKYGFTLVM